MRLYSGVSVPGYRACGFIFTHPAQLDASGAPTMHSEIGSLTYEFHSSCPYDDDKKAADCFFPPPTSRSD
jgi:hypothetical protein